MMHFELKYKIPLFTKKKNCCRVVHNRDVHKLYELDTNSFLKLNRYRINKKAILIDHGVAKRYD